jgi:protein TonB
MSAATNSAPKRRFLLISRAEWIIIGIVVLVHVLFFVVPYLEFPYEKKAPPDDTRVMANLVSPEPTKADTPKPPAPQPKPKKEEQAKKPVEPKTAEAPSPKQAEPPLPTPPNKAADAPISNAAVAPSSSGGASGTPIQTDIGKLVVLYQPDADPYYPSFSKRAGEQGAVVVRLIINESGEVYEVALLQSSTFQRLDRAAIEIGRRYRFKPFLVNGAPVKISTNLLIKFNLK